MVDKPYNPGEPNLIVIAGPTAVGKTSLAIELAEILNTEIISADSRQFYRGLIIGTAAPDENQLARVKHHFIGHINPEAPYNISRYEQDALKLLKTLFTNRKSVVLTGGSGLYIKAVCEGIDDLPEIDPVIREYIIQSYKNVGLQWLQEMLLQKDPDHAAKVDLKNPARLIRALEVTMQTGVPYSRQLKNTKAVRDFNIIKIAVNLPRNILHDRISQRVDTMISDGLLQETESFYPLRHLNALNTVGYKEMFDYLDNLCTLEKAVENIKTNTRRYARRQITWFNGDKDYKWLSPDIKEVTTYLKEVYNI